MTRKARHAASALGAADDAALFPVLLAWWRDNRHPRIAELAIAVGKRLGSNDRVAVGASAKRADHEAWMEVARRQDPLDMPRLLSALRRTNTIQGLVRLSLLREPDPHLVPALFQLLREPASRNRGGKPLWRHVIGLLVDSRDVRARYELDKYLPQIATYMDSQTGDWLRNQLENALPELVAAAPALAPDEERAIGELERRIPTATVKRTTSRTRDRAKALLDQIYAAPDDLGARAVYADVVGGEVGEFIVSQLQGSTQQPSTKVANTLLGPLTGICTRAEFVNGFPEVVTIWKQRPSTIRPAIGLREWALVRSVTVAHAGTEWRRDIATPATRLFGNPVMSRLDHLENIPVSVIARLTAMPSAQRIGSLTVGIANGDTLEALGAFGALRRLGIVAWHADPIAVPLAVAHRIERLDVQTNSHAWWQAVEARGVRHLSLRFFAIGALEFERTETGLDRATLNISHWNNTLLAVRALEALPSRAIRTLVVRGVPKDVAPELAAELGFLGSRLTFDFVT